MNQLRDNRPLILLIHSDHFIKESPFKNIDVSISKYINEIIIEKKDKSDLYSSLEILQREERLKDDVWFCNKCNNFKSASKKVLIYKSPNYLIIHLKRFHLKNSFFSSKLSSGKNECFIDFPIRNLDLSKIVIGKEKVNSIYDLYGIIEHFGGLSYGHYIAKCKNFGKWYEFNDSKVSLINDDKIVTQNAYILFYKKKGLENEF
jgi:ubiquitin carboxyl-terminal hydrolase 4/11/15